ncbi:MAG: hypothetical protein ACTHKA_10060 [Anaerocolumna jejuensis]
MKGYIVLGRVLILGVDDDFDLPFNIFLFSVPNSTKMPAAVTGRLNYTKLAVKVVRLQGCELRQWYNLI